MARYLLTEPFYDNLVLWESGEEVDWDGPPAPSMIPLDEEATKKLEAWHKERGIPYLPPLSEVADTLDGKVTVAPFHPGDRKKRVASDKPFPVTPGKPDSKYPLGATKAVQPMAVMPQTPVKPTKNFDRAPR